MLMPQTKATCAGKIYIGSTACHWGIPPGTAGVSPGKEAGWKPALPGARRAETADFTRTGQTNVNSRLLSVFAAAAVALSTSGMAAQEGAPPEPVVSWSCAFPQDAQVGDEIMSDTQIFTVKSTDESLQLMRILPFSFPYGPPIPVRWVDDPVAGYAISTGYDAFRAGVLQVGTGGGKLNGASAMTLVIRFKMNAGMPVGGPPPGAEIDGQLIRLPPGVILGVRGRGASGKAPHVPFLELRCKSASGDASSSTVFNAAPEWRIRADEWTTLVATWDANASATDGGAAGARMWLNGKEVALKRERNPLRAGSICPVDGPIMVGGDRAWGNVAMALANFSIYGAALTAEQAILLSSQKKNTETLKASESVLPPPAFEQHPELDKAAAWSAESPGVTIEDAEGKALLVKIAKEDFGKEVKLLLRQPLVLNGAKWVNLWHFIEPKGRGYSYKVEAIFEKTGAKESSQSIGGGYDAHIGSPNSRASALWKYLSAKTPNPTEGVFFKGLKITVGGNEKSTAPGEIYLCGLGLERIDYKKTSLYYVVGGFRDNFGCVGFNGCGARAMSDFDGGAAPFVRLDNLLDYAKRERPKSVNLRVSVYDSDDRLVAETFHSAIASVTTLDAFQRIEIPVNVPGTYRVKGKSYDAATGAYFTTDWCQFIVVKGGGAPHAASQKGLSFSINPDKPFGRLESADPKTVAFNFEAKEWQYPLELKYAVIPYSIFTPGWSATRPVKLERSMAIEGPGKVEIPYESTHCVELVVAEVWKDGLRLDREERPIGIGNACDKSPPPSGDEKIPSLSEITANGGLWMNSQIHTLQDGAAEYFKANLGELKKLTPISGFNLDISHAEPIPGVYNWDFLDGIFDTAAQQGCRILPYMAQKWPAEWMPVEFIVQPDSSVHHGSLMWGYMVGKYNYCTGAYGPDALRVFNQQLARKYANHPGLAGFYFENEHFGDYFSSHDAGNRKRFSDFLKDRYRSIEKLNEAWGSSYADFSQTPVPTVNPDVMPRKTILADFSRFRDWWLDRFSLDCQFDAVRKEDPRHPILVYCGVSSREALAHIAANGGMMANGGVHADLGSLLFRENYAAIPGLMERMEPHGMWEYEPIPFGYDEMVFGMLPMGGRGLNFHFFLGKNAFDYEKYKNPNPTSTPPLYPRNGYARILETLPLLRELRAAERIHDQVGILSLRSSANIFGMSYRNDTGGLAQTLIGRTHYGPRICFPGGELARLDSCKVIFVTNDVLSAEEARFIKDYLLKGGCCVMEGGAAKYCLDDADKPMENYLLAQLGIDPTADGGHITGMDVRHDIYKVGKGHVLLFPYPVHPDAMVKVIPLVAAWAGVSGPMGDSDDPGMLLFVLQTGTTYYLVTDHTVGHHDNYQTNDWSGKIRFCKSLPAGNYEVADIWNGGEARTLTPEEMALGFDAGLYHNKQMKIFRIRPATDKAAGGTVTLEAQK